MEKVFFCKSKNIDPLNLFKSTNFLIQAQNKKEARKKAQKVLIKEGVENEFKLDIIREISKKELEKCQKSSRPSPLNLMELEIKD